MRALDLTLCLMCDETGLFPLRARDLLAGLRSSLSRARNGKIRHISIRGDSRFCFVKFSRIRPWFRTSTRPLHELQD